MQRASEIAVPNGRLNAVVSSTVMPINKRYHGFGDNIHIIKVYVEVLFGHYDFLITH